MTVGALPQGAFGGKSTFHTIGESCVTYLSVLEVKTSPPTRVAAMNAVTPGSKERSMLLTDEDGNSRVQIAGQYWLSLQERAGWLILTEDAHQATPVQMTSTSNGSTWQIWAANGGSPAWQPVSYGGAQHILNINETTSSTFAATMITPSLAEIQRTKKGNGYDLRGVPLADADFSGVDLEGTDFTGGDLTRAKFTNAQLAGAVLRQAILTGSSFTGANLDKADFSQALLDAVAWGIPKHARSIILTGCSAVGAKLGGEGVVLDCTGANLAGANLSGADLRGLVLKQAVATGAILADADLRTTTLDGATLRDVTAPGVRLAGASLQDVLGQGACLAHADLTDADLSRAQLGSRSFLFPITKTFSGDLDSKPYPQQGLLKEFTQHGAKLATDSRITVVQPGSHWLIADPAGPYELILRGDGIDVFRSQQRPAVLRGAVCLRTTAPKAILTGADLRGIAWYGAPASLAGADLQDASLTGSLLATLDLSQAQLSGTDLSASVLVQAKLRGSTLGCGGSGRPCSLDGALLLGTDFTEAVFTSVPMLDAAVALPLGVPLFELAPADKDYLTQDGIAHLAPKFAAAGHPLGKNPTVTANQGWLIDNSTCTDKTAPRNYRATPVGSKIKIYAGREPTERFTLPMADKPLFTKATATPALVHEFAQHGYALAADAPITPADGCTIKPTPDATNSARVSYTSLQVCTEPSGALPVYGTGLVQLRDWASQLGASGLAFGPTTGLLDVLDPDTLTPSGFPFSALRRKALTERDAFTGRAPALR